MDLFQQQTRTTDPETSHEAEKKITKSGRRQRHCDIIYSILKTKIDGLTTAEITTWCTYLSESQVHKRMKDLVNKGLIRRGKARKCRVKGSKCSTWWLI